MVAPELACQSVTVEARGRENPLPDPSATAVGILPEQGRRQLHPARSPRQVVLVLARTTARCLARVPLTTAGSTVSDTVLVPLAASHGDLVGCEVDILDREPATL